MTGENINKICTLNLTVKSEEDIYADREGQVLRVKHGNAIYFKISSTTKLRKLKRAFCEKVGVSPDCVVFRFGSTTVDDNHAPVDLFMIDGDIIIVRHTMTFMKKTLTLPSTWVEDFRSLLHKPEFTDVVLVVGEERVRIPAIKAILCARSEKFRGMFSTGFAESSKSEVELRETQPQLMKLMLQYLYTDVVEVPADADEAAGLMVLAEEYILPRLKRECEIALLSHVKEKNVCFLLQTADMYNSNYLKDMCKQYVLDNIESKPHLGEELLKSPRLLLELTRASIIGNKRRRM